MGFVADRGRSAAELGKTFRPTRTQNAKSLGGRFYRRPPLLSLTLCTQLLLRYHQPSIKMSAMTMSSSLVKVAVPTAGARKTVARRAAVKVQANMWPVRPRPSSFFRLRSIAAPPRTRP